MSTFRVLLAGALLFTALSLQACSAPRASLTPTPNGQSPLALPARTTQPTASSAAEATPTRRRLISLLPSRDALLPSRDRPTELPPTPIVPPTPAVCADAAQLLDQTFYSRSFGNDAQYRLWIPPCFEPDQRYPVLYLLHGNSWQAEGWEALGLLDSAENLIRQRHLPPFYIVMPEGGWLSYNSSGGPDSYESYIVDELVPEVGRTTCASGERRFRAIGGISRGGYWAFEIAFLHTDTFGAVGGHSASLLDIGAGPEINPRTTGLTQDLSNLRIYFDIGRDDAGIFNTQQLHEQMLAADVPHEWHLNPGGHTDAYWQTHFEDYLRWYAEPWLENRPIGRCLTR